jgi:hypothetical protein
MANRNPKANLPSAVVTVGINALFSDLA